MLSYILKELVRYNVHLGHYYWECNNLLGYFLLGTRNLINIINIYNTIYNLRKILYIVFNLGIIKQRILLTNNIHYPIKSYLHKINKDLIYINKKWTGGLLTNQKELYIYNKDLFYKFYDLGYRSILPAFVFVTNIENNSSCIFEAMILNIINSSLFDTNLNYYGIFYKICSNDENFAIMMFFVRIIAKIYIKGSYIAFKQLLLRKSKWKLKEIQKEKKRKKKRNKKLLYNLEQRKQKDYNWRAKIYNNYKFIKILFEDNIKKMKKKKILEKNKKRKNIKKKKIKFYEKNKEEFYKKNEKFINKENQNDKKEEKRKKKRNKFKYYFPVKKKYISIKNIFYDDKTTGNYFGNKKIINKKQNENKGYFNGKEYVFLNQLKSFKINNNEWNNNDDNKFYNKKKNNLFTKKKYIENNKILNKNDKISNKKNEGNKKMKNIFLNKNWKQETGGKKWWDDKMSKIDTDWKKKD